MIGKRIARAALAAGLLLATAGAAMGATPASNIPTAEDFGALPFLSRPILSPGGNRIAARALVQGTTRLIISDFAGTEQKTKVVSLGPKDELEWYRWAGNDTVLVSLSFKTMFFDEEVRATRLLSYDVTTGTPRVLGGKEQGIDGDDLIYADPAGKFILLSTQASIYDYPSVFRIDLATGKGKEVVKQKELVWDWYADQNGVVRAGTGRDGKNWFVWYRKDESTDFTKTIRRRTGENDDGAVDNFTLIPGSDQGYAVMTGHTGRFGLYRYDFAKDQLGELVYENPAVDITDFDLDPTGKVQAIRYTDDRARIEWFDQDLKGVQTEIEKAVPGKSVVISSVSADRQRMIVWVGSARDPGSYYIFDRGLGRAKLIAVPYDKLKDKVLADMQSVTYKARDGLDIPAYLTLPEGRASKNLPLIMMPHGGPFARDEWGYDVWAQYLASRGYAVLQPNFRGSTGYGTSFVAKGNGQWGRGMQDDIDDGVKWLVSRGIVDPKRVCIMGASFGGYAAEWAAIRNPEIYRCAISFAGVSDLSSMLKYDRKSFAAPRYFRDWRARIQGTDGTTLDAISPLKRVADLKIPILIAHGDDDDTVPLKQSRMLVDALTKLGRPPEFYVYKGEKHGFAKPENQIDFLNRVGVFLQKYNPS